MDNNSKLTLQLTPQQLDYLGNVLGQRPYVEVVALLTEIQQQLQQQQQRPPVQPLTGDMQHAP